MKRLNAALIAALLAGTVCLCGCDPISSTGNSYDDDYGVPRAVAPAGEQDEQPAAVPEDGQGRPIKGFRDMIADKYGEADNSGVQSDHDMSDTFGE